MPTQPNIPPKLLQTYEQEMNQQGSPATVKRKKSSLKKFFKWAEKEGHIENNPAINTGSILSKSASTQAASSKKLVSSKNLFRVGGAFLIVALIFLLISKLKLPIPFKLSPASEDITLSQTPSPEAVIQQESGSNWTIVANFELNDGATETQSVNFELLNSKESATPLWQSSALTLSPNETGGFTARLDEIPTDLFFQNEKLFLSTTTDNGEELIIPVSTANQAANLQGYYPEIQATANTVPVLDNNGSLVLASEAPAVSAPNGNLLVSGQAITISTPFGSSGDIEVAPDASGDIIFMFGGNKSNFQLKAPNLTAGSLIDAQVRNNATGYDFINFQGGSTPTTRFSIDALGNTNMSGNLSTGSVLRLDSLGALSNITNYSQTEGNFSIVQAAGDTATITKNERALSDLLTLSLDERHKANSSYSTLTLKRYEGAPEAAALFVDEGSAIFDHQLQLGRYTSNPDAIGSGSLIFNTADSMMYVYDGTSWDSLATGGSSPWSQASGVLYPTTITDDLAIGGTDSTAPFFIDNSGNLTVDTNTLVVDAANNRVGIGTATPSQTLEVVGRIAFDTVISTRNAETMFIRPGGSGGTAAGQYTLGAGIHKFNSSGSGVQVIFNNGDIGIGTETPGARLHVTGTVDNEQLIVQANAAQAANILEIQNSSNNVLSGVDERGILFSDGDTVASNFFAGENAGNSSASGASNIAIGRRAGQSITSGANNIAIGTLALNLNETTNSHIAIGVQALQNSIASNVNMAIGTSSLQEITIGEDNMGFGPNTGKNNVTGNRNVYIGSTAGLGVASNSHDDNVFVGFQSAKAITTGSSNVLIGKEAGLALTSGASNIFLGHLAGDKQTTLSNLLIIDNQTRADIATELTNSILYGVMAATPADQTLRVNADLILGDDSTLEVGGLTGVAYNSFANSGEGPEQTTEIATDNDLYIGGDLEVDGTIYGTLSGSASSLAWDDLTAPDANLSLAMSTFTTDFNWATGTSTNDLFSLTTDASADGTGSLLNIQTGASATVLPLRVRAGAVEALMVDASGNVGINTTGPDRKLDVLDDTDPQLRLTQTDGTVYADFQVDSNGDLTVAATGGDFNFTDGTNTLIAIKDQGVYPFLNLAGKTDTGNPATCAEGDVYYNAFDDTISVCHSGNTWEQLDGGGGGSSVWNDLIDPGDNLSLSMTTYTTDFNWATGTSTNDLFSLTTDASANGTGSLLNIQTGASATVLPLRVRAGAVEALMVDAGGQVGIGNANPTTNFHLGSASETHTLSTGDALISNHLELDGVLYLDGAIIANLSGTTTISFTDTPTTDENVLSGSSWLIDNTANLGKAALMVDQQHDGDLFTASASGTAKFTIENDGDLVFGDGSGTDLTVGGGSGKVDVGTVDPVYNVDGVRYATYMAGMIGVKEEITGTVLPAKYIPGIGYKKTIDFKLAEKGSDLWLFSKTTDLSTNIENLIVLLSSEGNSKTWYTVDSKNHTLSIYSSSPNRISYRLTAPRFDADLWTNYNDNENSIGFILEDGPLTINENGNVDNELSEPMVVLSNNEENNPPFFDRISYYNLVDGAGKIIQNILSASEFIAANIKAGAIETQEIATDNLLAFQATVDTLLINNGLVSPMAEIEEVKTSLISPLADSGNIIIQVGSEENAGGKLAIQNVEGEEVASIDEEGDATFNTLFANEIISPTIDSQTTTLEEIENILKSVEADQQLLLEANNWNTQEATNEAKFSDLAVKSLFVTGQASIDNLSVYESISLGNDFVIDSKASEGIVTTTLNTITAPLHIQSLALAPLEIMAGLVKIDTLGNMQIMGDLTVAGEVKSSGLTLKSSDTSTNILNIQNSENNSVAQVNSDGEASFSQVATDKLIIAANSLNPSDTSNTSEVQTNASAGVAIVPELTNEITIYNSKVTDQSLIYLTPLSSTQNKVLYVKEKQSCSESVDECIPYFVAGFNEALSEPVNFNWWIVDIDSQP